MIKAQFKSYGSYVTDSVYQWDLNQKLSISGLVMSSAPVIAYSSKAVKKAIIVQSKIVDGVINCDIPNALLQFDNDITAHLCSLENKQYKAVEKMIIPVIKRAMPADYLFTDNVPILTYEAIEVDIQHYYNLSKSYTDSAKSEIDIERKRIDNLVKDTTDNVVEYKADNFLMSCKSDAQASTTETALNVFKNISSKSENLGNFITISSNSKIQIKKSGLYSFDCKVQVTGVNASTGRQYARLKINDVQKNEYMISLIGETDEEFTNFIVSLNEGDTISFTGEADFDDTWITLCTTIHILDYDGKVKIPDITKEVSDIRVGVDNTVYDTAGQAVREQLKKKDNEISSIKEDLGNIIINDIVQKASVNILNPETCVEGSYITNTGTYVNQTGYGHSSKIFVKPGQVLRVTYWGNVKSQRGVFFNSLDEKVSSIVSLNDLKDYTDLPYPYFECTVPDGATYVIVNLRYSYINTAVMITLDNDFPQNFVAYVEEIVKKKLSDDVFVPTDNTFTEETKPANSKAVGDAFKNIIKYKPVLYGKNIMFCGDSITFGAQASLDENGIKKNYGYYIQKATGCNAMFNAISGSTMTNISGRNSFSVDRYKNLGDDLDYIILAFGTNDSSQSKDLIGKYGDTTNETFYGAWKIVIDYLIANYPTTKIGIIGFWRGNQSYEWTDALRDISNKYRIPMLDFMFDRNIPIVGGTDFRSYKPDSPFTVDYNTLVARQQTFLADTVHPNDVGYQYISPIIQNYIESL